MSGPPTGSEKKDKEAQKLREPRKPAPVWVALAYDWLGDTGQSLFSAPTDPYSRSTEVAAPG